MTVVASLGRRVVVGLVAWGCAAPKPGAEPPPRAEPAAIAVPAPASASAPPPPAEVSSFEYRLTQGSERIIRSLRAPLHIDAYVKTGTQKLDRYVIATRNVLRAYERVGAGNVTIRVIEPRTPAELAAARALGIVESSVAELDPAAARDDERRGVIGFTLQYGRESASIPRVHIEQTTGSIEFWLTNKARELRARVDGVTSRIGVVTGKREVKLTEPLTLAPAPGAPSMEVVITSNFPFYSLVPLELGGGRAPIAPELAGLIITQPGDDYTDLELRRIDEFLMRGGKSLVVFASAVNVPSHLGKLAATLSTHRLERLLDGYGIRLAKDAVLDAGCAARYEFRPHTSPLRYPAIVVPVAESARGPSDCVLDSAFPPLHRLPEVAIPFASSLTLDSSAQPADVELRPVVATSEVSTATRDNPLDLALDRAWKSRPPLGRRIVVGALAEGKLRSAFSGKPSPLPAVAAHAPEPSRVFVLASSLFTTNPFGYASRGRAPPGAQQAAPDLLGPFTVLHVEYLTNTILAFKNTLDWMMGDGDLVDLSDKLGQRLH